MHDEQTTDHIKELLESLEASGKLKGKKRNRTKIGKPKCSERSFSYVHPQLVKEWHPTKNGKLQPSDVSYATHKSVWWICSKNPMHEWDETVFKRHQGYQCPFCPKQLPLTHKKSLFASFPQLACVWHPTKNNEVNPNDLAPMSKTKVWWICKNNPAHEWEVRVSNRVLGSQCPYCVQKKISSEESLATVSPELGKELHPYRNGSLTAHNIHIMRVTKVWWICLKDRKHRWMDTVKSRLFDKNSCPFCLCEKEKRIDTRKSLSVLSPERAKLWHPVKNGELTPKLVTNQSSKYVWWLCPKDASHEWQSKVCSPNMDCPLCVSLCFQYPKIAKEFHPRKNHPLELEKVHLDSSKKLWWRCTRNTKHEWQTKVKNRIEGQGCPECLKEKNN